MRNAINVFLGFSFVGGILTTALSICEVAHRHQTYYVPPESTFVDVGMNVPYQTVSQEQALLCCNDGASEGQQHYFCISNGERSLPGGKLADLPPGGACGGLLNDWIRFHP